MLLTGLSSDGSEMVQDADGSMYPKADDTLYPIQWEAIGTALILSLIIVATIVGNVLVILSVFTYRPLRIVQNFFIVSLAVADLTVAILVLPLNVAYSLLGRWVFGIGVCRLWLTSDVLCCTASIFNLCAIALDRYWAITDPINYAQKRTLEGVLTMITGVWVLSLVISSPQFVSLSDWPEVMVRSNFTCHLTSNPAYVILSSCCSFFIPLAVMTIVYLKIYIATRRRLRERARSYQINTIGCSTQQIHHESISSETTDHDEHITELGAGEKMGTSRVPMRRLRAFFGRVLGRWEKYGKKMLRKSDGTTNDEDGTHRLGALHHREDDSGTGETRSGESTRGTQMKSGLGSGSAAPTSLEQSSRQPTSIHQFIEERQKISLSKRRRAARILGIIMGVFVVCWLPFFLMYAILTFCPSCCPTYKLTNFITWLGYINSALNPIIYTIFNLDFRRAFKRLLGIKP